MQLPQLGKVETPFSVSRRDVGKWLLEKYIFHLFLSERIPLRGRCWVCLESRACGRGRREPGVPWNVLPNGLSLRQECFVHMWCPRWLCVQSAQCPRRADNLMPYSVFNYGDRLLICGTGRCLDSEAVSPATTSASAANLRNYIHLSDTSVSRKGIL